MERQYINLYQSANVWKTTWFEFAKKIVEKLDLNAKIILTGIERLSTLAKRPRFSVLETIYFNLKIIINNIMQKWEEALDEFVEKHKVEMSNDGWKTKDNLILQKSYMFSLKSIEIYKFLCDDKKEYVLSKQLLRAITSNGANINEAQAGISKKDLVVKMSITSRKQGRRNIGCTYG